ncbi:MAG: AzlD domain-containing protein [Acidimicrobiia bacterium]
MTWTAVLALTVGSYALKAVGLVVLRGRRLPAFLDEVLVLLPAALFGALIVVSTIGGDRALVIDARVAGVAAAAVALWRRAGFVVVVLVAATTTALVRAIA